MKQNFSLLSLALFPLTLSLLGCGGASQSLSSSAENSRAFGFQAQLPPHVANGNTLINDLVAQHNALNNPNQAVFADFNDYDDDNKILELKSASLDGKAKNRTTCAPFVTRLLQMSYNKTNNQVSQALGSSSPSSEQYYDIFANGVADWFSPGFRDTDNLQMGDIIAIKYNDPDASGTGHTMIFHSKVGTGTKTINSVNWKYVDVKIYDSTSSPHGANDSREDVANQLGAGWGIFRLYVNNDNVVVGHSWSTTSGNSDIHWTLARNCERPLRFSHVLL